MLILQKLKSFVLIQFAGVDYRGLAISTRRAILSQGITECHTAVFAFRVIPPVPAVIPSVAEGSWLAVNSAVLIETALASWTCTAVFFASPQCVSPGRSHRLDLGTGSSRDPSTSRPALANRAEEKTGRSARDDNHCRLCFRVTPLSPAVIAQESQRALSL